MRNIFKAIFLLFACNLLFGSHALAQWEYGGRVIGPRSPGADPLAVAAMGAGSTVVAWNRVVGGDWDVVAQLVDSAGYDRWPAEGLVVYEDDSVTQKYPAVLPDGAGGVFVAWSDWRHYPVAALYGQRLDGLGNKLWDPGGRRLTFSDTLSHRVPTLFPDGAGGFVAIYHITPIVWTRTRSVGAQRVDGNGNVFWDSAGITLSTVAEPLGRLKACRVDDSSYVAVWPDYRFEPDPDSDFYGMDIYMQRFDLRGRTHWGQGGIPVVHYPTDQGYLDDGHDVVPDGAGGCAVVWVDARHVGYNSVLYADRFAPSGQSLWRANGLQLGEEWAFAAIECQAYGPLGDSALAFRWGGGLLVSLIDTAGRDLLGGVRTLGTFPVDFAIYDGFDQTFKSVTFATGPTRLARKTGFDGIQFWPDGPFLTDDIMDEEDALVPDGSGGAIFVWKQQNDRNVRMTRVYNDGHVGGGPDAVDESDPMHPNGISLYGNFPNPFNSQTSVHFALAEEERIEIVLTNILGQLVAEYELGVLKGGDHKQTIDLSEFPSGVYLLALTTAKGSTRAITVVLVK